MAAPIRHASGTGRAATIVVGLLLVLAAFLVYWSSEPGPLEPRTTTSCGRPTRSCTAGPGSRTRSRAWPACPTTGYFQDVYPLRDAGRQVPSATCSLPFPPLPALVLLPFVAVWGLAADQAAVAIVLAALGVGARLVDARRAAAWASSVRAAGTIIFATGTAWWWAAAVGSTWYFAHLVAVDLALVAVGVALRHDPRAAGETPWRGGRTAGRRPARGGWASGLGPLGRLRGSAWPPDRSQVLAGLLLGLAVTARLPLVLRGALVHAGRRRRRSRPGGRCPRASAGSCRWRRSSPTRTSRPARSCTPATTTSTSARPTATPRSATTPDWSDRGHPLHPPEPRDHARVAARGGPGP